MVILGIDQATTTGWCHLLVREDGHPVVLHHGKECFKAHRTESRGMMFVRFNRWLVDILALVKPDLVVYDRGNQRGGAATEVVKGLSAYIEAECTRAGVEYTGGQPSSVKLAVLGKGNASKEDAVRHVERLTGKELSEDEADAVCLALYGHHTAGGKGK